MNEHLARQRILQAAKQGNTRLDLSRLGLETLPPKIRRLASLTELNLSENHLTALPPEIGQLASLTQLDLSDNQLTALPPEIGQLASLTKLNLSYNQLTALPPEIGQLASLTKLNLSGNHRTALPPEIGRLANLTGLNLRSNQLTALPPEIGQLASLTELNLSENSLTALPPEIGALTHLQTLDLTSNYLTALPTEIGALTHLQTLDLTSNYLTALPTEISQLASLTKLDLRKNQLTALPPEIWQLPGLVVLAISSNPLPALPPELWQKTDWRGLELGGLRITALPPEIGQLANLAVLNLSYNQLTALPPEIGGLERLINLNLDGNPLTLALPRALLDRDPQAILRFYRAAWQEGRPLGEARVLFVGQPAVGKTSLVYRLKDNSYEQNRPSTLTVETHHIPLGERSASLWDFGGQDFMHATHPFFFSARCVYVLVLNVRQTYDQNRVEYWLRTLRLFGGDSPVIVVGNHADTAQHVLDLPQNRLRREFPNLFTFAQTSAAENTGLEDLRQALERAVDSLPHVRVLFARSHLAVKAALEQEQRRRDIIPYARYAELCAAQGIDDQQDQRTLLALMHDLGVVLDFRNEAGEPLSPDGVLNPNWVTNAIYRVITDQELRSAGRGRLTPEDAHRILQDYAPYHRDLILKLLQRFELAYPAADGSWYLPSIMPQDEPASASAPDWAAALTFEYLYPELPESVITRFLVRSREWSEPGQVWRWGTVLRWGENRALVRASPADKKVTIQVVGPERTRRDLLALVRAYFEAIHKTFTESAGREAFAVQAFVYPSEYPGLALKYQDLLTYERDGLTEIPAPWQGRTIPLNVAAVLNGFTTPQAREEEHMPKEIHYHEHKHFEARDVSNSVVNLGDNDQIQQSITASPEIARTLQELTAAAGAILARLPAAQAEEARADLEHLQEELQKPRPSKKWYSVSIEGLIQAAKNAGEVGGPVIMLAKKLLELLGP